MIFYKKGITAVLCAFTLQSVQAQSLKDAIKLTENEQFVKAGQIFKQQLEAQPTNGDVYFFYGENYFKNDNLDSARILFQKGIDVNASNPLNYVGVGKVHWYNKNTTEANAAFHRAKTLSQSKNATVLYKIAEAYIKADTKNIPEAFNLLNAAAKLEPNNPEIYILMGDAHLEQNINTGGSEAIKNYEKASSLDKKSVKAILRIGQLWVRAANYNLALDYYKKANALDSTFAPAYREKAELYYKAKKYKDAINNYRRYLDLNNDLSARTRYAKFLYLSREYQNAITEIKEVQKTDSSDITLYRYAAYSYYELKDYTNGMANMNKFLEKAAKQNIKLTPQDYEYQGKLLSETGKDSLAIAALTKAIELDTANVELYGDLGAVYMKQKKYKESAEAIEKKIAAGKGINANDYFKLGRAHYFAKDYVKADSAFARVTKDQPNLHIGHLWRAKSNSQLDPDSKQGLAKPHYEQVVEKAKADPEKNKKDLLEAYEYLGAYYFMKKDYASAKPFWQEVKKLDPNNVKAKAVFSDPNMR